MHVLVTGANGFVGSALVARLQREPHIAGNPIARITLIDTNFATTARSHLVRELPGSIANREFVAASFDLDVDLVFHLASIPGGAAEQNYLLSRDVNLLGTMALLEACKAQTEVGVPAPRFVFASSIGVFGFPLPDVVTDGADLSPQTTYGTQKLIGEILVADFTRHQWIDGCSLRLPSVLARPPAKTGHASAFLSNMIRDLTDGRAFTCPTCPAATTWAASIHNIVDNLLHGATVAASLLPPDRALTLPATYFSMQELVAAIDQGPPKRTSNVSWQPDSRIEALFGRFTPLTTARANAAGFSRDPDLSTLVRRALQPFQ